MQTNDSVNGYLLVINDSTLLLNSVNDYGAYTTNFGSHFELIPPTNEGKFRLIRQYKRDNLLLASAGSAIFHSSFEIPIWPSFYIHDYVCGKQDTCYSVGHRFYRYHNHIDTLYSVPSYTDDDRIGILQEDDLVILDHPFGGGPLDVFKSFDGGRSWIDRSPPIDHAPPIDTLKMYSYNNIQIFDYTNGIAYATVDSTSSNTRLAKTTDGGETWHILHDFGYRHLSYYFMNPDTGFAFATTDGKYVRLYKSVNAGITWLEETIPDSVTFGSIQCGRNQCYMYCVIKNDGGAYGYVLKECHNTYVKDSISISLYPNPASSHLQICFHNIENNSIKPSDISIYDCLGRLLQVVNINSFENHRLDLSKYRAGLYLLKINGTQLTAKFIKQ